MHKRVMLVLVTLSFIAVNDSCQTTKVTGRENDGNTRLVQAGETRVDYLALAWDALNVRKDYAKAIEQFDLAEKNGADKRQVFLGRIWAYNGLGNTDKAWENGNGLYSLLVKNPVDPAYQFVYAADALRWGSRMPNEALVLYGIQIAQNPDAHSLLNRGTLFRERGEMEKAKADLAVAFALAKKTNSPEIAQIETALVEVSLALHDGQYGLINAKPVEMSAMYNEYIDIGLTKDSSGFDWNQAGKPQGGERDNVAIFTYMLDNFDKLSQKKRIALNDAMKSHAEYGVSDGLALIDVLGSKLSSVGLHPFSGRKLYYFPNGSGDKAVCKAIEFFPSGMPRWLKMEGPREAANNRAVSFSIPSQAERINVYMYADDYLKEKLRGSRDTKGIYPEANEAEFWETGSLRRLGNFAYTEVFLPADYRSARNPAPTHSIVWTKEGKVYQLIQASDENSYRLSDNMKIGYFYSITWMNLPECKIEIGLENAIAVELFFKKGTHTLYKEDSKTKKPVSYSKTFDKDTMVKVIGGFWVNSTGDVTRYWGEMK